MRPRSLLLAAALLAVLSTPFLLTKTITWAQSDTATAAADPNAIPQLTAQATANGILLTWTALPNAVRYELLAYWDASVGWQPIGGSNLTGTTYTHADVVAGITYYYSIRAVYADSAGPWLSSGYPTAVALAATGSGTSTPTPTPTATPGAAAPNAIPELTAQATANGILLTWEAVPNAVRYELLAYWDASVGWQPIGGSDLTGTTYTHSGATAGTTYHYSIRAIYADGAGPWLSSDYPTVVAPALTDTPTPTPTPSATAAGTPTPTPTVATTERGALIALYESTDGDNWTHNDNWLTGAPLDTWYGVTATTPQNGSRVLALNLQINNLRGTLPDLRALTNLKVLFLAINKLHGPIPDLSLLNFLKRIHLERNRLAGPVFDLHRLTSLQQLELESNDLSGPVPRVGGLAELANLSLTGNGFCLPTRASLSHAHGGVDAHLKALDPPACTATDLAAFPAAPANLSASVAGGRVALSWDAVAAASSYDLWVWDSLDRTWGPAAGALTGTSHSHPVLTDGRNYYFQVRARDASGARGPWSERAHVLVTAQPYPPPPPSLGLNIYYQKYLKVLGVIVTAPSEVSDAKMAQAGEIVTGMYAGRPAYFEELSDNLIRIALFKYTVQSGGIAQLPELRSTTLDLRGALIETITGQQVAAAWDSDDHCYVLIHEFAHAIHSAIKDAPGGEAFNARLHALYEAAMDAGLWQNAYAGTNAYEYWAETVTFWFQERIRRDVAAGVKLADYDPEIAKLIADTFGEGAHVPAYCKP